MHECVHAQMLDVCGVDKVISVDLQRAGQNHEACFFEGHTPVETVDSTQLFVDYFAQNIYHPDNENFPHVQNKVVVLSSNTEFVKKAKRFQRKLEERASVGFVRYAAFLDDDVNIDTKILLSFNPLEKELLDLKDEALVDRTEIKQLGISDKINTLNQSRIKKEGNPELNVFAGIGIQTEEFNFDGGGPLYTIGLSMSMNIIDGGLRKKKIEQLKFEREKIDNDKARLNQKIEIEITQNYYQIKSIESQEHQ